jgi:hypothetical protein
LFFLRFISSSASSLLSLHCFVSDPLSLCSKSLSSEVPPPPHRFSTSTSLLSSPLQLCAFPSVSSLSLTRS